MIFSVIFNNNLLNDLPAAGFISAAIFTAVISIIYFISALKTKNFDSKVGRYNGRCSYKERLFESFKYAFLTLFFAYFSLYFTKSAAINAYIIITISEFYIIILFSMTFATTRWTKNGKDLLKLDKKIEDIK